MIPAPYDPIASEYYDDSHKTSRNFDLTSLVALQKEKARIPRDGLVLDVGAGRGRCTEFLDIHDSRIVQLDNSLAMLNVEPREPALLKILHNAESLPFADGTFSCVTAFLCDPFLGLSFLHEAQRVLREGGLFIGTTPSYEWGFPLRETLNIRSSSTRFITRAHGKIIVPSTILPKDQLRQMLTVSRFNKVSVVAHKLPRNASVISDDIVAPARRLECDVFDLDILYTMCCEK
jgi:SAM-dependent methyltransferase